MPPTRILCINCNVCINTFRRYLVFELNTRVISLLSEWISPVIITEEDYICEPCNEHFMRIINQLISSCDGAQSSGSSQPGQRPVCITCGRSILNRQSHSISLDNPSEEQRQIIAVIQTRIAPRQISQSDKVCHSCWMSCKRAAERIERIDEAHRVSSEEVASETVDTEPGNQNQEVQSEVLSSDVTLENYRRAANTASHCLFPQCTNTNLHSMTDSFRATVLSTYKYYIPVHSRVCAMHRFSNEWNNLYDSSNSIRTFTAQQVEHVFSFVNAFKPYLNFTNIEAIQDIEENIFFFWTGRSKQDFFSLLNEVPRLQQMHNGILGLGALLIKMRTGESDVRLSTLLDVPRSTLERLMNKCREILVQDFVPMYLGITHMSRESLMEHNLIIPNGLYNENYTNAIIICDGTYININKSSNYSFQKDTYSLHKYRNLLKPFLLVACDGYILDCFGPYKATTSDAEIMNSLFGVENSPLRLYFQENDVFILDRGFRDSIRLLEDCGYQPYMPDSLLEGEHQLTTQQANRSRCVTLCRWVVEVVNGHFKRDFKLLRQDYFNKSVPTMMQNFQIAASLLNRFGVRLHDRDEANEILSIIRERIHFENNLALLVNESNMNRRCFSKHYS